MAERKDIKVKSLKEKIISDICEGKPLVKNKVEDFMKLVTITINGWQWYDKEETKHYSNEQFLHCLTNNDSFHTNNKELTKILEGMMQAAFLLYISEDNEKAVRAILMAVNELDG